MSEGGEPLSVRPLLPIPEVHFVGIRAQYRHEVTDFAKLLDTKAIL